MTMLIVWLMSLLNRGEIVFHMWTLVGDFNMDTFRAGCQGQRLGPLPAWLGGHPQLPKCPPLTGAFSTSLIFCNLAP
jgi:hypothetical protein